MDKSVDINPETIKASIEKSFQELMHNPNLGPSGRGPLGHHQTEKEMWGVTNLNGE